MSKTRRQEITPQDGSKSLINLNFQGQQNHPITPPEIIENPDLSRPQKSPLMDLNQSNISSVDRAAFQAVRTAFESGDTSKIQPYLWGQSPFISFTATAAMVEIAKRETPPEMDEMGRIEMGRAVGLSEDDQRRFNSLRDTFLYGTSANAAAAAQGIKALNATYMTEAMKTADPAELANIGTTADQLVRAVLEKPIDQAVKEYTLLSRQLESRFGGLFTPSDLQLEGDAEKLERSIPTSMPDFDVRTMLRSWHGRFNRVQSDFPVIGDPVLTVYGSCVDRTYNINQGNAQSLIDHGLSEAAKFDGRDRQDVVSDVQRYLDMERDNLPPKATTATEFMGLLMRRMAEPISDKTSTASRELDAWVDTTFTGFNHVDKTGGASGNISVNLPREPNIVMAVEHNHPELGLAYDPDGAGRIKRFSLGSLADGAASMPPISDQSAVSTSDPLQIGRPFEFDEGINFDFNGSTIRTVDNGRMIFGGSGIYYADGRKGEKSSPFILTDQGQPLEDESALRQIGRKFKKVIFNGLHYVKPDQYPMMATQIRAVKDGGGVTHAELSGVNSSNLDSLSYLGPILKENIDSIAFNDGETVTVAKAVKKHIDPAMEIDEGEGAEAQAKNGRAIAKALGLKRLHIHGQDFDIVLRQGASEQDMQSEVAGGMWQKYQIYKKLTGEGVNPRDVAPNLKVEAMDALMDFAVRLTSTMTQDMLTEFAGNREVRAEERPHILAGLNESLILNGYAHNQSPEGYSIALLPPKWIYGERKLYPTGAGDTSSGNQFVHSGMYAKQEDADLWRERAHIGDYFI